jgi:hypothetical protein
MNMGMHRKKDMSGKRENKKTLKECGWRREREHMKERERSA